MAYPFKLPPDSAQPHPSMILNHTVPLLTGSSKPEVDRWKGSVANALKTVSNRTHSAAYQARYERWNQWTRRQQNLAMPGFDRFQATVKGRLAVGLGEESISENGITLSWIDGAPIIPGSAIKGLIGAAARSGWFKVDGNRVLCEHEMTILSGTVDRASYFTFHDAWYVPADKDRPLVFDVMTPHHQTYNTSRGGKPPVDSEDPTIIHFLTTHGTFLFAIEGPDAAWTRLARDLLVFGLEHLGIGAKTSSGYGRFLPPASPPQNGLERHDLVVRARQLTGREFDSISIALAEEIAETGDDQVRETAARAFAQRTVDLEREAWLRDQEDWIVLEEYLAPAFDHIHGD